MTNDDDVLYITPHLAAPMVIRVVTAENRFALSRSTQCGAGEAYVEFYDRRYVREPGFTPYGQFIRCYCLGALQSAGTGTLILDDGVPHWSIDPETMKHVQAWLRLDHFHREQSSGGVADHIEICPKCGKPLYDCQCRERWEDEGGAVEPEPDNAG